MSESDWTTVASIRSSPAAASSRSSISPTTRMKGSAAMRGMSRIDPVLDGVPERQERDRGEVGAADRGVEALGVLDRIGSAHGGPHFLGLWVGGEGERAAWAIARAKSSSARGSSSRKPGARLLALGRRVVERGLPLLIEAADVGWRDAEGAHDVF